MPRPPADAEDLEAIRAALSGDESAFGRLVERYGDSIFNLTRRMTGNAEDAEDLAQEAFLRAYAGLKDFRVGARVHPWLYTIALNLCRNFLRRKALLRWVSLQGDSGRDGPPERQPAAADGDPEQALLEREAAERLQAAVAALPWRYREVLVLRQAQELTYDQIAQLTGLPLGTVEVRLFRARRMLLKALAREAPGKAK